MVLSNVLSLLLRTLKRPLREKFYSQRSLRTLSTLYKTDKFQPCGWLFLSHQRKPSEDIWKIFWADFSGSRSGLKKDSRTSFGSQDSSSLKVSWLVQSRTTLEGTESLSIYSDLTMRSWLTRRTLQDQRTEWMSLECSSKEPNGTQSYHLWMKVTLKFSSPNVQWCCLLRARHQSSRYSNATSAQFTRLLWERVFSWRPVTPPTSCCWWKSLAFKVHPIGLSEELPSSWVLMIDHQISSLPFQTKFYSLRQL